MARRVRNVTLARESRAAATLGALATGFAFSGSIFAARRFPSSTSGRSPFLPLVTASGLGFGFSLMYAWSTWRGDQDLTGWRME